MLYDEHEMTNHDPHRRSSDNHLNIQNLLATQAEHIHQQVMTMPTNLPIGRDYDHWLQLVAHYKQAHTAADYAAIVADCTAAIDSKHSIPAIYACYSWLPWIARWQLEAIVGRQ